MTRKELLDGYSLGRYFRPKKKKTVGQKNRGRIVFGSWPGEAEWEARRGGLGGGWLSKEWGGEKGGKVGGFLEKCPELRNHSIHIF